MERREQAVEVVKAELKVMKNTSSERVDWVRVELNTGHAWTCRLSEAPKVGDRLLMSLDSDDSLDVVREFTRADLATLGREATMRVPNDKAGVSL